MTARKGKERGRKEFLLFTCLFAQEYRTPDKKKIKKRDDLCKKYGEGKKARVYGQSTGDRTMGKENFGSPKNYIQNDN